MRDMHRERLTHLLANAILELWKKETGSLSSVIIEGTICITSGTGKTTVLQVADRFSGSIPEADQEEVTNAFSPPEHGSGRFHHHNLGMMRSLSMPHYNDLGPRVDCHSQASMAAFLDNLSPASLVSPGTDHSRSSRESRSPSAVVPGRGDTSSMDVSTGSFKDDLLSESGSDSVSEDKSGSPSEGTTGGICPGTGYYTCATPELNNNNVEKKGSHMSERSKSPDSSPERMKRRHSLDHSPDPDCSSKKRTSLESQHCPVDGRDSISPREQGSDAMDLTRKDSDDLALSPPQSYTAQVRDVIRQRLLAAQIRGHSSSIGDESSPTDLSKSSSISNNKAIKALKGLQLGERETGSHVSERSTGDRDGQELQHKENDIHEKGHNSMEQSPRDYSDKKNDALRVNIPHHMPPHSRPMLSSPISPIMSPGAGMMSIHAPLAAMPRHNMTMGNGPLHAILRRKPFMTPPLRTSVTTSSPSSAPPMFSHPGFSPLAVPQQSPRDASPSPTDLSIENSNDDKEVGPNGEQRVYRCEFCTKTFLFKSKYHEHLPVHTNARPFQCHLCSRTYKYKYDLRVHLRTHMGIPTKSTVCPFCNTKFDTNKMLRVHIKDAHKDKQKVTEDDCSQAQETLTPAV